MGETPHVVASTHPGRIAHVPALDGLRGLAVLAVLAYHQGWGAVRGGFLGVSLFFTLSGYLIASLLMAEHAATGRIDLRAFWSRRVRRLAPAGLLGIVLALGALVVAVPKAQWAASLTDVRAALVQLSNWRFVLADAPYADVGTTPSPVLHYWSLAIEEQFYLLFPVVALLALRRGRRALGAVMAVVAVASVGVQVALPATDRVYFGTDTRAAELALGVLLAVAWPWLRDRLGGRHADLVGVAGLALTALAWATVAQSDPLLLGGGLGAVGVLSVMVLVGALGGRVVPRLLSGGVLRGLGLVSYGLYVVHFPIFLVLSPGRTGLSGVALFAVRVAVSLAVAGASYALVERHVRRGRPVLGVRLQGRPGGAVVLAGLAALAVLTVPLAQRTPAVGIVPTGLFPTALPTIVATPPVEDTTAAPVAVPAGPDTPADGDPGDAVADGGPSATEPPAGPAYVASEPAAPAASDPADAPAPDPTRVPRLVVVGDSTAEANGEGLQAWAARTGGLQVSVVSSPGCAVLFGEVARYRPDFEFRPTGCEQLFPAAIEEVRRVDADALVVFIGAPQLADWRFGDDPSWRSIEQADIARAYQRRLDAVLASTATLDVPVLWADVPVPDWDLDSFGDMIGGDLPGAGEPVINDPARTAALNTHTAAGLGAHVGAVEIAYADGMAGPDGTIEPEDREDGLHMSEEQVVEAADTWLMDALAAAWDAAWTERDRPAPPAVDWTRRTGS